MAIGHRSIKTFHSGVSANKKSGPLSKFPVDLAYFTVLTQARKRNKESKKGTTHNTGSEENWTDCLQL